MVTISFKVEEKTKKALEALAFHKGINTSAYIKLVLTEEMNEELARVTENGFTVAEELEILKSAEEDEVYGPFDSIEDMMKALSSDE